MKTLSPLCLYLKEKKNIRTKDAKRIKRIFVSQVRFCNLAHPFPPVIRNVSAVG
jgi:hypothetical protein